VVNLQRVGDARVGTRSSKSRLPELLRGDPAPGGDGDEPDRLSSGSFLIRFLINMDELFCQGSETTQSAARYIRAMGFRRFFCGLRVPAAGIVVGFAAFDVTYNGIQL
jgi:hypothetical protein